MIKVLLSHLKDEEAIHNDFNIEEEEGLLRINGLATLVDDGNGLCLRFNDNIIPIEYHEAEYILALLLANYDGKMELARTIKSI